MTAGNLWKKYIGSTDEPLCPEGIAFLQGLSYPVTDRVYVTQRLRTRQTAELLFPGAEQVIVPGLEEMNFGIFEGKSYEELKETPEYQVWLNTNGEGSIPQGECKKDFCDRCENAFKTLMKQETAQRVVFVVHGGTIMALLWRLGLPRRDYYHWQVKNGQGFALDWDGSHLIYKEKTP